MSPLARLRMLSFLSFALAPITFGRALPQTAQSSVIAYMVRQDFSDCSNGNVSDANPSLIGGSVVLVRDPNGTTHVKVGITAQHNTTYHFFLKCVRILGDVITGEEGVGENTFDFPTNSVGEVYAFDMYPEGAPAGNKYQSMQVKF
jgi:hypothetical protein